MTTATDASADTAEPFEDTEDEVELTWQERAKRAARHQAENAAIRAKTDLRSTAFRNRRQLQPLKLTAATAATGTAGALIADNAEHINALAASPATGAVALAGGALALRQFRNSIPTEMLGRVKTGLAAGCAWCAALPLTGAENMGMWLALGLGTVGLSARWWQRIRPGYPDAPQVLPGEEAEEPGLEAGDPSEAEVIMDRFERHLTVGAKAALKGAGIDHPRRTEHGWGFTLSLVPGEQDIDTVRQTVGKIASAIDVYDKSAYTFEQGATVTQVDMRITTGSPLDNATYQGPRIVREGGDVFIEVGPYCDGDGYERFHVLSGQDTAESEDGPSGSIHGGFLLGSKNSGKSRVFELLATGMRELGIQLWWMDPQNGASSAALKKHANWPLMGVDDGIRTFGNARSLYEALCGVRDIRNAEQGYRGEIGFVHTRQRPAIMVLIDECHKVFNAVNPDTGNKFGFDFGELDRETRKLGIAFLGGSQIFTMDTFGNSGALRSGMTTGNLLVLRMTEKSHAGLLPGHSPNPEEIPKGGGYGYNPEGQRPQALWRAEYLADPSGWLASLPVYDLDQRAAKAAGDAYLRRNEAADQQNRATGAMLDAFDSADPAAATQLLTRSKRGTQEKAAGSATETTSRVPARPTLSAVPDNVPERELKPREQELLALLDEHGELSTAEMASQLGISDRAARNVINSLGETYLAKVSNGVYRLARPVPHS